MKLLDFQIFMFHIFKIRTTFEGVFSLFSFFFFSFHIEIAYVITFKGILKTLNGICNLQNKLILKSVIHSVIEKFQKALFIHDNGSTQIFFIIG